MAERTYSINVPFDLNAIVKTHGWFQLAPFYWQEQEKSLCWVVHLNGQPRCVRLSQTAGRSVTIACSGLRETHWCKLYAKFRHVFNLDLNLKPFYQLCATDPLLRPIPRLGMGRIMRSESIYEDVFKSICGTNVMWKQAVKMVNSISRLGEKAVDAPYFAFPSARTVLHAGKKYLIETGRVGYRADYLLALCERMEKGDPLAEKAEKGEMHGEALLTFFQSFKGIGKITARYLAALYGYFGEMAVDSAVLAYMAKTHFHGRKPSEKEVRAHYDRFGEWRYLAYWMEFIANRGWTPDV